MKLNRLLCILTVLAASASFSRAATQVTVSFDSGGQTMLDHLTASLSGSSTLDGNGTVLQLGYYSGATTTNNFLGTWIPLSGEGSLNTGGSIASTSPTETFNKTSIGDRNSQGAGNGSFALSLTFVVGNVGTGNSLPSSTTIPLSIRFYDGYSIGASTFYNVVSDDAWLWKTPAVSPADPTISMSLDDAGLEWQSIVVSGQGVGTAFHTSIAIPEASTFACVGMGLFMLVTIRRFRRA